MTRRTGTLLGLATSVLASAPAHAQAVRPLSFGVAAGVSQPLGDLDDAANTGFTGMLSVGFQPPARAFGLRVDGMYHRFGLNAEAALDGEELPPGFDFDGNTNVLAGVASVVLTVSNAGGMRPYLLGGGGLYRLAVSAELSGPEGTGSLDNHRTDFSLAGGGGIAFPLGGLNAFVEARIHSVFPPGKDDEDSGNTNFVPIVVGITF